MAKGGFECDIEQVFDKFCTLTQTQMTGALKRGLRAGAKALVSQTKTNLSGVIKTRHNPQHRKDGGELYYFSDEIEDAVRIGKSKKVGYGGNADDLEVKVHIMGKKTDNGGTHIARFIEKGTKQRFAKHYRYKKQWKTYKKPANRGKITGKWYFKAAQGQVLPTIESIYIKEIDKAITKINNS